MSSIDLSQPGAMAALLTALNTKEKPVTFKPSLNRLSAIPTVGGAGYGRPTSDMMICRVDVCDRSGHVLESITVTGHNTYALDELKAQAFRDFRAKYSDGQVFYNRVR